MEDEQQLVSAYRRYFGTRFTLAFAASGEEAVRQMETFAPDLVVLDMRLPDTDGVDLLRQVRTVRADLPVVVTTAYASMQPMLEVLGLGHSGFLVKPFELSELAELIGRVEGG